MSDTLKASAFDLAFNYTVKNEGGFSNQTSDSGGATQFGITHATLSQWLGRPASIAEVKALTLDTAKKIYERNYWLPLACDKMRHTGTAMAMFDIGVVRGIGIPPMYAQEVCIDFGIDLVKDGHIGPITLAAINSLTTERFVTNFKVQVETGFRGIVTRNPSQLKFLDGWLSRATRLMTLTDQPDSVLVDLTIAQAKPMVKVELGPKPALPIPVASEPQPKLNLMGRLKKAWEVLIDV